MNILPFEVALSNHNGNSEILVPEAICQPSTAAIGSTADQLKHPELMKWIKIKLERFDDIAATVLNGRDLSFIKCDVEGHEKQVFDGARDTISRYRPIIVLEILREKWKDGNPAKSEIALFLTNQGYIMVQVQENGIQKDPDQFKYGYENFLFLPDNNLLQILMKAANIQTKENL